MSWADNRGTAPDYWAFRVAGPVEAVDAIIAWFEQQGVQSVQWEDGRPSAAPFTDYSQAPGDPFVLGYFPADTGEDWEPRAKRMAAECRAHGWEAEWNRVKSLDWAEAYKAHYRPIALPQGYGVVPAWYDASPFAPQKTIWLDPGLAFGTGLHATTRSCLEFMIREGVGDGSVLDLGAGSGILAMMAIRLGAETVDAVEPDPVAVDALTQNLARNGFQERVRVVPGTLADVRSQRMYRFVCMNLIADLIAALWPQVARRLDPERGRAILSGIIEARAAEMEAVVEASGFQVTDYWFADQWTTLVVRPG